MQSLNITEFSNSAVQIDREARRGGGGKKSQLYIESIEEGRRQERLSY